MDSVEDRDSPPAFPAAPWLCPADRMVVRRFRPLKYLRDVFLKGLRFGKAEHYEKYEGRGTIRTRISELLQSSETSNMILRRGNELLEWDEAIQTKRSTLLLRKQLEYGHR